jgi:hypothetical protein
MDKFQYKVKEKLIIDDKDKSNPQSGYKRISKIVARKAFVFDTYKDASLSRNEKANSIKN